jgi:hypothetical protein
MLAPDLPLFIQVERTMIERTSSKRGLALYRCFFLNDDETQLLQNNILMGWAICFLFFVC